MKPFRSLVFAPLWVTVVLSGCGGGKPSVDADELGVGGVNASKGGKGSGGNLAAGASNVGGTTVIFTGQGGSTTDGGAPPTDPCLIVTCGVGQRCIASGTSANCVDRTCEELACSATEECRPATGGGNVCVSVACTTDAQCPAEQFCDGTRCQPDVCAGA